MLSSTTSLQPLLEQEKADASSSEVGLAELLSSVDVVLGCRRALSVGGVETELSGKRRRRLRLRSLTNDVVVVEKSKPVLAVIFLLVAETEVEEGGTASKSGGGLEDLTSTSMTAISATALHFFTISISLSLRIGWFDGDLIIGGLTVRKRREKEWKRAVEMERERDCLCKSLCLSDGDGDGDTDNDLSVQPSHFFTLILKIFKVNILISFF